MVKAFNKDSSTPDNPLGKSVVTDDKGMYTINYIGKDFCFGGKD